MLIPAALSYTFGKMVKDTRQGWAILAAMFVVFVPLLALCAWQEQAGNPALAPCPSIRPPARCRRAATWRAKRSASASSATALFATATTGVSCGAVNGMHDSFTPLGGLVPLWLIQLGEIIFGGVGAGLYGMLMFAIVAVFVAGLMVGRTPEYLGKKIEAKEMKMASLVVLVPAATMLVLHRRRGRATRRARRACSTPARTASASLYAFSPPATTTAARSPGLGANSPLQHAPRRRDVLRPVLRQAPRAALAGALAQKKLVPTGAGTLPTHTPLFVAMLVGASSWSAR